MRLLVLCAVRVCIATVLLCWDSQWQSVFSPRCCGVYCVVRVCVCGTYVCVWYLNNSLGCISQRRTVSNLWSSLSRSQTWVFHTSIVCWSWIKLVCMTLQTQPVCVWCVCNAWCVMCVMCMCVCYEGEAWGLATINLTNNYNNNDHNNNYNLSINSPNLEHLSVLLVYMHRERDNNQRTTAFGADIKTLSMNVVSFVVTHTSAHAHTHTQTHTHTHIHALLLFFADFCF